MRKLQEYNRKVRKASNAPSLRSGDIVKIHRRIKEGSKERIQVFEGIVIAIKGRQSSSPMITVRRMSFGIGVEITIPMFSPAISKIETVKRAKTRQAKLYYLREKDFRLSKLKMKELDQFVSNEEKPAVEESDQKEVQESGDESKSGGSEKKDLGSEK